ncbi:extracellular solute-binding protein [Alicyclobacillus macrosporangiidus]|uniref:extracellular solute-binding protein n=1 Tax=Alicyclobacillus macrosporangiidus TaxID=392015 RepID=UPI0006909584|nr:extracellular solute-binding protein [Alicyclobacillus macrosporangiidus]
MKKTVAFAALTALVSALSLSGCGNGQPAGNNNGSAPAAQQKTLRILTNVVGGKTPQEDALFAKEIQRLTGIQVELVHPPTDYDQKLLAAMSSGEKFDVIYCTKPTLDLLVSQGVLTPLTNQIKNSKVLSDTKVVPQDEWDEIRSADGQIYGVPVKYEGGLLPIVRQDWMQKLHLSQPKTLDDFYKVLKAFKDDDPDGDGKADTYGLTLSSAYDIQPFMSAVGLQYGVQEVNGKKVVPYATDAAVPVYEWLHKLYQEGILDPKFVTNSTADERNEFLSGRVGMFVYWDAWVGMLNNLQKQNNPNSTFDAEGIPGAVGPDGKIMLRRGDPSLWAIPKNAPHPDVAFQFLEWWNTKPGEILGSLGIEGYDYTVKDGTYTLTDTGKQHNMDHGDPNPTDTTWKNPFGSLPGYDNAKSIILQYGTVPKYSTNWTEVEKSIVWHYIDEAITGHMSAQDAVHKMHDELQAKHVID